MQALAELPEVLPEKEILAVKHAETSTLRKLLNSALEEAFTYRERIKRLEAHLYMLSQAVLAGEWKRAQEYAHKAQVLLNNPDDTCALTGKTSMLGGQDE